MSDKESKEELLLFAPKSNRGLKMDYPEIREIKEFQLLRPNEMLFVWYYACKSSPFYNLDIKDRDLIDKCIEASSFKFAEPKQKAEYLEGKFTEKIRDAIRIMNGFEPSLRVLAKIEAARTIIDIRKMTSLPLDKDGNHPSFKNKDDEIDFTKKKQYMDMVLKSSDAIPQLIMKGEQVFGLVDKNKTQLEDKNMDDSGKTFAETFHENQ